ncbi:hypothetical protein LTR94_034574, partial [Friedmanniomyces endolithicus]
MSLFDLTGKVVLITGSSRGIGKASAIACAEQGAKVVISSRKQDACEAVAGEINARGLHVGLRQRGPAFQPAQRGERAQREQRRAGGAERDHRGDGHDGDQRLHRADARFGAD